MRMAQLHNHTKYSIKDALPSPLDYVKAIYDYNDKNTGHEIVTFAVTDHSNMYSCIEQTQACCNSVKGDVKERTLKPIYGNEIYHIDTYVDRDKLKSNERYHLVLLAKNDIGLKNLFAITTEAGMHKIKGKTKDFQLVEEKYLDTHGEGIIALSACSAGKIGQLLIAGKYDDAKRLALHFNDIFDEFYLEIQPHDNYPDQVLINSELKRMSAETGLPMVITGDTHYLYPEDKEYHNILKEIDHMSGFTVDAHMRTPEELIEWCKKNDFPLEIIENTAKIADSCTADITIRKPDGTIDKQGLMPDYPVPEGYTQDTYLKKQIFEGFKHRFITNKQIINMKEYIQRLNYEFHVISSMNFSGYFLILWDWFKYCRENGILLGPGRGSGAGSLVTYCLDITKIDPIKNKLVFERFLNPERQDDPDVDTDISKLDRKKAIKYLENKYGSEYVCQIATFGQYKVKNTIKAVLSADKGFTAEYQNSITKEIPDLLGGEGVTYALLEDIYKNPDKHTNLSEKEYKTANKVYEKLQTVFEEYPEVEKAVRKICGAISSIGCHAGGVVISSRPLVNHLPLMTGGDSAVLPVSQLDMEGMHFLRALKIDALGLKTLSQINLCMKLAGLKREWYDDEYTDDEKLYEYIRQGNTCNIFQMAKHTPTQMIKDFNVHDLEGLTAVNACNRPGPLAKGDDGKSMVDKYAEAVITGEIEKLDDRIDDITKDTNNQLIYQEQLMFIGQRIAGYSLGNADQRIRKIVAKKLVKQIPEIRNEFIYGKKSEYDKDGNVIGLSNEPSPYCKGALANGYSEELAIKVFKAIEASAAYSFNKSHSCAYAFVAYKTMYLSYYYPVEWAIACMTLDTIDGKMDSVLTTLSDCKKKQIKILPPDINESSDSFSIAVVDGKKCIRFGLLAIKDVGAPILKAIRILIDKDGPFTSFDNFLERTVNNKTNTTLKNELVKLPEFVKCKEDKKTGQKIETINNPFSKRNIIPLIKAGAFDGLEPNRYKLFNDYLRFRNDKKELANDILNESDYQTAEKLRWEMETLGYYVSQHPLDSPSFPYVDLSKCNNGDKIRIAGLVKEFKRNPTPTKNKKTYYKLCLEFKDGTDMYINIWDNIYNKYRDVFKEINSKDKNKKAIVILSGIYSKKGGFVNINISKIERIRSKQEQLEDKKVLEPSEGIPKLEVSESVMDENLYAS